MLVFQCFFAVEKKIKKDIVEYIEREIIPQYASFDRAHNVAHARTVIAESLKLAGHYNVDMDMVYVAAAYHDLGLCSGRERHHLVSGEIVRGDAKLRQWFSNDEIDVIAAAVEDHRASNSSGPRSLYGRIVAEADRHIVPDEIIRRTVEYGLDHHPGLGREEQWERTKKHLAEKYGEGGYLRLLIPESDNARGLGELRETIADERRLRLAFDQLYNELVQCAVRKATESDVDEILQIVAESREEMRRGGNAAQWVNGYPSRETILADIARGDGYIIYGSANGDTIAYFAFIIGIEPTYNVIEGGQWEDDGEAYGTIHRLAKHTACKGVARKCLHYCKGRIDHLRADTHRDNTTMQHILACEGFAYRGIIYVSDGTERLAYQWKRT